MRIATVSGFVLLATMGVSSPALKASDVDAESAREQALALSSEAAGWSAGANPGTVSPEGGADGPLFIGVDDVAIDAVRVDVGNNGFATAFNGFQVWGAAYDAAGDQVYFNSGSTLLVWPVGGAVTSLGTIVNGAGAAQSMVGLAFTGGTLYGTKNIANEAIWEIDTTTLVATVHIDYVDADFDCGGFDADPVTGDFYCANDDTAPLGTGLYRINPDASGTLIAPYPAGETDLDGLAIGSDGRAYLVEDDSIGASGRVHVWDFGLAAYQTPLNTPWPTSEVFSAGAWIAAGGGACQLTCPANVTQANDVDQCGAVVNYPAPTEEGDCGPIVCAPAAGSFFPVGTTTVTCQEQIPALGQGPVSCSFTTTVNDTQPPSVTPPPAQNVGTEAPACTAVIAFPAPGSGDNCPGQSAVCAPPSGSVFPLGTTTVTCTTTDASGNTASGSTTMTVVDDDAPALVCPADIEQDLPPGETEGVVTFPDPTVSDNCPSPGAPTCVPASGDTFPGGETTVVNCSALDAAGNAGNCAFNVTLGLVSILEVPAASTAGLAALALLLAAAAFVVLRRIG